MGRKKEDYTAGVGGRVRQLLIDRGISVQKWADHLNVPPAHCYQIIQGGRSLTLEIITVRIKPGDSKEDTQKLGGIIRDIMLIWACIVRYSFLYLVPRLL
jgi:predicted transcriptional regulator